MARFEKNPSREAAILDRINRIYGIKRERSMRILQSS
jgi:hypothetical protein